MKDVGCNEFCIWPDGFLKLCHVIFPVVALVGITLSTTSHDEYGYLGNELAKDKRYFFVYIFWRVTTLVSCTCGFITLILWCLMFESPRKYIVVYLIIVYYAMMFMVGFLAMIFGILHLINAVEWYSCVSQDCPALSGNTFLWMIVMGMISSMVAFFSYVYTIIINIKYVKPPPPRPDILERERP